jgi:site-specific recombinase XerD
MRLFKRENGTWYIELKRGQKRSLKTKNKAEAQKMFAEIQKARVTNKLIKIEKSISLERFIIEYTTYAENHLSESTKRIALNSLNYLCKIVTSSTELKRITPKVIDDLVSLRKSLKHSITTINMDIRTLKSCFSKAVEWEYLDTNPIAKYKQIKQEKPLPKFLTKEEINKVRSVIDDKDWLNLFEFYIYTGGRRSEVLSLTWKNIADNKVIFTETKSKRIRKIPISNSLANTISRMQTTRKIGKVFPNMNAKYVSKKFTSYFQKAGLHGFTLHSTRHTFASQLIMSGVDLRTVQELLGHSDYSTTLIYSHLTQEHLTKAIEKLNF